MSQVAAKSIPRWNIDKIKTYNTGVGKGFYKFKMIIYRGEQNCFENANLQKC